MDVLRRHNVRVIGQGTKTIMFAHGYGCDQNMWRLIVPAFEHDYRLVLFDYIGHGRTSNAPFDPARYATLEGYAADVIEIGQALDLRGAIFVGHSVSCMIGVLAAQKQPDLFERLVFLGPSPCYINDDNYVGGFTREDISGLLEFLDTNHFGWSSTMAPVIMGNADRPELAEELAGSFCRTNPEVAKHFAKVTFLSDNRQDLGTIKQPCLIVQCSQDSIAPRNVGDYVHEQIPDSTMIVLVASGHCPHLSAPQETIAAIKGFIGAPKSSPG